VRLVLVSIGTPSRAKDFVQETGFPAEDLYVDPENVAYDRLRLRKGVADTFLSVNTPYAILERIQQDGAGDLRDILPRWKPWLPPRSDQGLQQGGLFVFDGDRTLLEHYDEATGQHCSQERVRQALALPVAAGGQQ